MGFVRVMLHSEVSRVLGKTDGIEESKSGMRIVRGRIRTPGRWWAARPRELCCDADHTGWRGPGMRGARSLRNPGSDETL
jgi:hypothetical protein